MEKQSQWRKCNVALRKVLARSGTESAYGRGHFWIVDQPENDRDQKVCVFWPGFLTRQLILEVQRVLRNGFSDARVFLVMEPSRSREREQAGGSLLVYADRVEENCDRGDLELARKMPLVY